jgi:dolichol-phosphate mannosyltransferase
MGDFAQKRVRLSDLGSRVSRLICHCEVTDPMSGFFIVDSRFFRASVPRLTGTGFKILVDILASSPAPPRLAEVPYRFRNRVAGESKLDVNVELEYLFLIVDKLVGRYLPTRFVRSEVKSERIERIARGRQNVLTPVKHVRFHSVRYSSKVGVP